MATGRNAPSTEFVFVLGTGRCGSTLLHEVLARHPDVGFLSNVDDRLRAPIMTRWSGAIYRRVPASLTKKGRVRFAPSEGYRILDREVSPAISTPVRDLLGEDATPWLAQRFRAFFERQSNAQGKPIFLHKFTGWPRARFIQAVFPRARFVHVIRDGRAVANSLLQMPWWAGYRGPGAWGWGPLPELYEKEWETSGRSFPVLAALQWRLLMDAFQETKSAIATDRWLDVRYEDFVDRPRERTEELLRFIGLTWSDAFERKFREYQFETTRTDAFRRDLGEADLEEIEGVIASNLRGLGYLDASQEGEIVR
jgi:hypothetical protein